MTYDNNNRGALFVQKDKKTDKSPDYTWNVNIDGTEYQLSWRKQTAKSWVKYLSLTVRLKDEQQNIVDKNREESKDDSLPF